MIVRGGEQGLAVVAFRDGTRRRFQLQARPFTRDQAQSWERIAREAPAAGAVGSLFADSNGRLRAVLAVMFLPLSYCPRCGANLSTLIEKNMDQFDALAASQSELQR